MLCETSTGERMRNLGAVVFLGLGVALGCFKPALPREDATDSVTGSDDGTVDTSVPEVDVAVSCRADQDCDHLDGPCVRGTCAASKTCETRPVSNTACDDADPCTRDDACTDGQCSGDRFDCDDGLACTDNACDGRGGCSFPLASGHCLIDGVCYEAGTSHPSASCRTCAGGRTWTLVDGGLCDDGDTCTLATTCHAGVCKGGRFPDDAPADFLKVFARVAQPIHELELVGLVPRAAGGVYATLRVRGTVILDDDFEYATPDPANVIVALDAGGEVRGAWAITGWSPPTVLGDDLGGRLMWSARCSPCTVTDVVSGAKLQPQTDVDRPAILFRAAVGEALEVTPLSHLPLAKDALDRTYLRVPVFGEDVVVRGAGADSVTLSGEGAAASVWLVELSTTGTPTVLNGVYFAPDTATFWPEFDVEAGPLKVMPDGRVLFPFFAAAGRLLQHYPRSSIEIGSNTLVVAVHQRDVGMSLVTVMSNLSNPLGFGLLGYCDATLQGDMLSVAGNFAGREVVFGGPQSERTYQSSQHWGLEGSGNFGAGQEAFFIRLGTGGSSWHRTLRPLGHPDAAGIAGSVAYASTKSDAGWLIVAKLRGFGVWAGLGSPAAIVPPSSTAAEHAVLAEFSDAGDLLWSSSSEVSTGDSSVMGLAASDGHSYLAGRLLPGTNGVGPSRLVDPQLSVPTPRLYIQRFNSAGGLSCGASP